MSNGIDLMMKWDGLKAQMSPVGVPAPLAAITLAGSGAGAIVGTYTAYLRYLDDEGHLSDLSPVSSAVIVSGRSGTITGATNVTPVAITSPAHGLTTGVRVKITGVGGNDVNDTWVITVTGVNTFTLDSSAGNGDYTGGGTWISGVDTVTYTGVTAPTDPRVARRQILRNTDGQADVYYVDVDTTDLTSTTFTSTRSDSILQVQTSQSILDADGTALANRHAEPPSHRAFLAQLADRMFAAGETMYRTGACQVTLGSTTVTGTDTDWKATFVGRFFYVIGHRQSYEVSAVDVVNQTLTLTQAYEGATDTMALYLIRTPPALRRLVYYTETGLYDSWPATNALTVREDNDEITGLMENGPWLYILERRHMHRLTVGDDPLKDGGIFPGAERGCVNNNCWVDAGQATYLLDEQGVYRMSDQGAEATSALVQEIFRPGGNGPYRIRWAAKRNFHAVHFEPQQTIRWFVCLDDEVWPTHAIAVNYTLERWWVEKYPFPITASCFGRGQSPQVYLGASARRVLAYWEGYLDGPTSGTVRGTVTSAGLASLADSAASFATSGVVGSPVLLVYGTGKGQKRIVTSVSGTTLNVDNPWLIKPDTTTIYQIGGIPWVYKSDWFRFPMADKTERRGLEVVFEQAQHDATMDVRLAYDFKSPKVWRNPMTTAGGAGVEVTRDSADMVVDMKTERGIVRKQLPGAKEDWFTSARGQFVQVQLSGVTNADALAVYSMAYVGAVGNK